jgi:flagellin
MVRMKDLATQSADASSTASDQTAMQGEYDALGNELNNILNNTTFGGSKLLKGGTVAASMTFQIGATSSETMNIDLSGQMTSLDTALSAVSANYTTPNGAGTEISGATAAAGATAARTAMTSLSTAIDAVGAVRSGLGAAANRLDHVFNNLSNISTNSKAATGRIMDVDFATESSNMTSSQMLLQAGTAMLKQTNSMSSMVMSLLQ